MIGHPLDDHIADDAAILVSLQSSLGAATSDARRAELLRTAPLPTSVLGMLEAATHTRGFLSDAGDLTQAASARMGAILDMAPLHHLNHQQQTRLNDLESSLADHTPPTTHITAVAWVVITITGAAAFAGIFFTLTR